MTMTQDCKLVWLEGQGFTGTVPDMWRDYLLGEGYTGQINDMEFAWLGDLGYTGQLNDRWFAYLRALGATGALPDMLKQFWCGEGGVGPGPGPGYLLDASFHRYPTSTPVSMQNNEYAASQDDPLWDDPNRVAEIDKGAFERVSGGVIEIRDSLIGGSNDTLSFARIEVRPVPTDLLGLFAEASVRLTSGAQTSSHCEMDAPQKFALNLGSASWQPRVNAANLPPQFVVDGRQFQESAICAGGYNAAGEPDPVGLFGALFFFNSQLMRTHDAEQLTTGAIAHGFPRDALMEYDWLRVSVQPALLETPHRSLFTQASDEPIISDYVPENGPGFTLEQGAVSILSGALQHDSGNTFSVVAYDNPGGAFWEALVNAQGTGGVAGVVFRRDPGADDYWFVSQNMAGTGDLEIGETVNGSPNKRAGVAQTTAQVRIMALDDGATITAIAATGETVSHPSVVGASNTGAGLIMYHTGGAKPQVLWECNRAGTVAPRTPVLLTGPGNLQLTVNEAMTPVDYSVYFSGPDLTYAMIADVPPGLSFDTATGILSGTPTAEATYPRRVTATNAGGTAQTDLFNIEVVDIVMLLDATFEAATGSQAMSDGEVMSDNAGDSGHVFLINKGSMTVGTVGAGNTMILQNQVHERKNPGTDFACSIANTAPLPKEIGLTIYQKWYFSGNDQNRGCVFHHGANPGFEWRRNYDWQSRLYVNGSLVIDAEFDYNPVVSEVVEDKAVYGGYNVSGEPDPLGAEGLLLITNDRPSFSHPSVGSPVATPLYQNYALGAEINVQQYLIYVDPAPLATPHRSLFSQAADQALSAYAPENGAAWTVHAGTLNIVSGVLENQSTGAGSQATFDNPDGGYWEMKTRHAVASSSWYAYALNFRFLDTINRWYWSVNKTNLSINEMVAGTPVARATVAVANFGNGEELRMIATDDGTEITGIAVSDGGVSHVASYTSVTGAANTRAGFELYTDAPLGSPVRGLHWFAARLGTAGTDVPWASQAVPGQLLEQNAAASIDYVGENYIRHDGPYSIDNVPTGMTFDTATGVLSGTPTVVESATATVSGQTVSTNAHSIQVAAAVHLDATFHRYGPAGPVALENTNVLDDTGAQAAEIDKGSMTNLVGQVGETTLDNEEILWGNSGNNWDVTGVYETNLPTRVPGYTGEWDIDHVATVNSENRHFMDLGVGADVATAGRRYQFYTDPSNNFINMELFDDTPTTVYNFKIADAATPGEMTNYKIVTGGFDINAEPQPAGTYGALFFLRGVMVFSMPEGVSSAIRARMSKRGQPLKLGKMQTYVDPAPLATPHRSIWGNHPNTADVPADMTPEDGAAWRVGTQSGDWSIDAGGLLRVAQNGNINTYLYQDVGADFYTEQYQVAGNISRQVMLGRIVSPSVDQGDAWEFRMNDSGAMYLYEINGGGYTERASDLVTSTDNLGRFIFTAVGASLTAIHTDTGMVLNHSSVVHQTAIAAGPGGFNHNSSTTHSTWWCSRPVT